MSSFVRPEVAAQMRRWRESLAGAGVLALGLYWAFFTGGGLLHWVGYAVAALGALLGVAGVQRARFRQATGGPGVVKVTEGRITYLGPLDGGVATLSDLTRLAIDHSADPPCWLLSQPGFPDLAIPLSAEGADGLFDVFAKLPGIRTAQMLREINARAPHRTVIWQTEKDRPAPRRLH